MSGGSPASDESYEDIPQATILRLCANNEWGQADSILRTLKKGAEEVNYTKEDGITSLMYSCRENKLVLVERLCEFGADINAIDQHGRSALHYAANYAKTDVVKCLLSRKADVAALDNIDQRSALHLACARGLNTLSMVQQILKFSPKEALLVADKHGAIPLFAAADSGSLATCKELLQQISDLQVTAQLKTSGDTILHLAAQKKDIELAKLVYEHGASVNAQNMAGLAPLHVSVEEGDEAMIKYLYSIQADPNICDQFNRTALHVAAQYGNTSLVELLTDKVKADPLARTYDGSTLLHVAAESGHTETSMALLKKGVPLMMPNKSGAICLHSAAKQGHVAVVKALLFKGAFVDAKTKDQYTSLHIAVEACQPLVIQTLLGYGAQVELKGGKCKETPLHIASRIAGAEQCVDMLIRCGADVNNDMDNGETALHIASRHGHLKVVKSLLAESSDPTLPSKSGETPLHLAVRYCHWAVCEELLRYVTVTKSRFDATILVNQATAEGETTVHLAAELLRSQAHHDFEDTDIMKLLLDYGGDTNAGCKLTLETPIHYCARAGNSDILLEVAKHIEHSKIQIALNKQARNGWSPLLVASKEGHLKVVEVLLQHHARVDVFDEHGKAALHLAAECGNLEVANMLLLHKAFVNAKSKIGLTPLHLAAQNGFNKLAKLLVEEHGAAVDALSLAKKTPMHMAAETGQKAVCATLLNMGADANAPDEDGQTPLHLAAENDHSDVIKLFLKHDSSLVTKANTKGMTYAHIAASKGCVGVIKELMKFNKSVICTAKNSTNASTSLHLAAEGGHHHVVSVLLASGADALEENADGMTPLHLAAKHGHIEVLEVLKDKLELTTSSSTSGFTALHVAAHFGQTNTVRELLNKLTATVASVVARDNQEKQPRKASRFKIAASKALAEFGVEHPHGLTPLHLAAQSGHQGLVRVLLNSPGVQADAATVLHGSIPLHLAAQNGHTAVISLLLSKDTNLIHVADKHGKTGLHLAAKHGQLDMIALLLGQGAEINAVDENGWTALHYASQAGHLEVVKLLTDGGGSTVIESNDQKTAICHAAAFIHVDVLSFLMKKEHNTYSLMNDKKFVFDLMVCGRINDQKSIEEFINLSPAPCETAAKMSKMFLEISSKEKERAKELIAASQFCEQMATDLMAIAASENSPRVLLTSVDRLGLPFLDVLIDCGQKEVVSHPTIQKYLSDVWMGGINWKTWKIFFFFLAFTICPPVWLVLSLPLRHRYCNVPIFKFMSYLVSHVYFIGFLVAVAAIPPYRIVDAESAVPNPIEWMLLLWFSGLLVAELTNPGDRNGLGLIKLLILFLGVAATVTQVVGVFLEGNDMRTCLYIRNQFLGISLTLCFVQILDFLSFHHLFGPWAIIIGSLVIDLVKFVVILAVFMFGFTFYIAAIYQQVYPFDEDASETLGQGNGNANAIYLKVYDVFELLFFSLFGLVDPENLPPVHSTPNWSRTIIKVVFGLYLLISVIVLINLLIAMMSDTYQRIQAQSDTEWKFGRAKLIRNMNKTSSTPSPINLLVKLIIYLKVLIKHKGKVCTASGQQLVDNEEGLNSNKMNADADHSYNSNALPTSIKGTRVAPDDKNVLAGPERVEKAINWRSVVRKYYANKGIENENDIQEVDDS